MTKKISIIVPCCNVELYVRECLESIKNQTYTNLEIICINDGSTDGTGSIIDEFVAKDSRFIVIHKRNSGYGDSMNKGLEMCTGDYIGIIESDDWIEPDMFEVLLQTAEDNNLDLARCCWFEGPTGTERINDPCWVQKNKSYCPMDNPKVFLQQPSIWASLYRRDLLENGRKIRFLPTPGASYQDTSFAFKAYTKSERFMMIDKCLHHYRINPNSSVSSSGKIFCIADEWEEMIRWVITDEKLREQFEKSALLAEIFSGGFDWNYNRLSILPRLKFLHRACCLFRFAHDNGVFDLTKCGDKKVSEKLDMVLTDPLKFHRQSTFCEIDNLFNTTVSQKKFSNTDKELISVIIPCYNTAKYILIALESVIRQDYDALEIICVDDCSTDETKLLVHHVMKKDKRIKWLCTETNSGLSAARNLGMKSCAGKYIIFLDGDDFLMPYAISCLHQKMKENIDVVVSSADISYEGGRHMYGLIPDSDDKYYKIQSDKTIHAIENINKALNIHVSSWSKLWRTDVIKNNKIQFPEGLLYEDANFFWKYLSVAPRIKQVKRSTYMYRRHLQGSIMSSTFNKKSNMSIQHIFILKDLYTFFVSHENITVGKKILNNLYESYFWFAYNNAPIEDYDQIFATMCKILHEQDADITQSPILEHISKYEDIDKASMFLQVYGKGTFNPPTDTISATPELVRLSRKLKKYRKNVKRLIILSSILLVSLLTSLIWIIYIYQ